MARWQTCYVCGGYARGVRHRACKPAYKRRRYLPCEACGKPARGSIHRRCRFPDAGRVCGYCQEPTSKPVAFHRQCWPSRVNLATFRDFPGVLQRQCSKCAEWWPFLSHNGDVDPSENWKPAYDRGPYIYLAICRSCEMERRHEAEARAA